MKELMYLRWTKLYGKAKVWILLSPALALVLFLFIGGLGFGIAESLNYMPIIGLDDPNLDAYRSIFSDKAFYRSLLLTLHVAITPTLLSVIGALASRGEFLTSYTPYQPEVSQGKLQSGYEFQTMASNLLNMDVANAGMYDGATSFAEAALMACRVTGRRRIGILETVSPAYASVVRTYAEPQGLDVYLTQQDDPLVNEDTACILTQHPNYYGYLEDLESLETKIHDSGSLFVVATDPIFVGMFKPPGEYGADIVVAEGQPLGIAMSYGGPYVGLFTCRTRFLRQMPGRIVGKTEDTNGREGYVLTLQTREQHIRRERATSNICTSEALIATLVVSYLACMGKTGLRHISEMTYHNAHYAASLIANIPGFSLPLGGVFFQEFIVKCPLPPSKIQRLLLDRGIICGIDVSEHIENGLLVCVTEMNTQKEISDLVAAMKSMVDSN